MENEENIQIVYIVKESTDYIGNVGYFSVFPFFFCEGWRMRNEILIIRMRYVFLQGKFIGWHKVLWYSIISRNVNEILSLGEVFFGGVKKLFVCKAFDSTKSFFEIFNK